MSERAHRRRELLAPTITLSIIIAGLLIAALALVAPLIVQIVDVARLPDLRAALALDPALRHAIVPTLLAAATGAVIATLFALPAARVIAGAQRASAQFAWLTLCAVPTLLPSHVHAYLWMRMREAGAPPGEIGPIGRVLSVDPAWSWITVGWVGACWLWPVPALLLAAGWRRAGSGVHDLALLDVSARRADWLVLRGPLRPYLVASAIVVFILCCVDYALPNLMLAPSMATELFLIAEQRRLTGGAVVLQCWPVFLLLLIGLAFAARTARRTGDESLESEASRASTPAGRDATLAAVGVFAIAYVVPFVYSATLLKSHDAMMTPFRDFRPDDWTSSLMVVGMVAAGLTLVAFALSAVGRGRAGRRWLRAWTWLALISAAIPATLAGVAFVQLADVSEITRTVQDTSPFVWCIALVSRFAFIPMLALASAAAAIASVDALADLDGATGWRRAWSVRWPLAAPAVVAGSIAAGLVALSEVAVSTLVRPPGYGAIAVTLLNQMHFYRQDAVIMTCLLLQLPALAAAVLLVAVYRLAGRRRGVTTA